LTNRNPAGFSAWFAVPLIPTTARQDDTSVMKTKATLLLLALAGACMATQAQTVQGDAKVGETKNAMCIGCHGIPGYQASFPQVHRVPMISGQNGKYIAAALDEYRKGERKHPSMRGVAASLSDQDIADLAAYYENHGKVATSTVPAQAELPAGLKDKLAACTACHGVNFSNTTDAGNPRLAGQHADYLAVALKAYQTEGHALVGRSNATMVAMAKTLSDADVQKIAAYLSSLPGELKTVPQSKFR
jgi:cytochrome c553